MSQAEDLLNSLSENDISAKTEPHIVVDSNRVITVPSELKRIAVQYDHNIETVTFDCPRYWDDHDMSTMKVYINYTRADNEPGCYIADDVAVDKTDTSIMHFSWTISRHVTEAVGPLTILICIKMVDKDGNEVNHWKSERNSEMTISKGMECGDIIAEKYPDIISQILETQKAVKYHESVDTSSPANLRDLDSGTYVLRGKYRPFKDSPDVFTFATGMLVSVLKMSTISYVQVFYAKANAIQYLEIKDSEYTRKDAKLYYMESTLNRVTKLDTSSDDTHYPSAKTVYDVIKNKKDSFNITATITLTSNDNPYFANMEDYPSYKFEGVSFDKSIGEIETAYRAKQALQCTLLFMSGGSVQDNARIMSLVERISPWHYRFYGLRYLNSNMGGQVATVDFDGSGLQPTCTCYVQNIPRELSDDEILACLIETDTITAVTDIMGYVFTDQNGKVLLW